MIPFPELTNLDLFAVEALEGSSKMTCEKEGLELNLARELRRVFRNPPFLKSGKKVRITVGHGEILFRALI